MNLSNKLIVKPGSSITLSAINASDTLDIENKKNAKREMKDNLKKMFELQYKLYAERQRSLLVVLQGIDAAGKDGTIRHVMSGLNPQGCTVASFKAPSKKELDHDYLWRIHNAVPRRGHIGIFNRSHYEDVLAVRVHNLVPESIWSARFAQINAFEKHLADNGTRILKFFLYIDKDEQKERFQARLDDPRKNWKFDKADLDKRKLWNSYLAAFEDALSKCSKEYAPWFIIPANKKWFRNFAISEIICETLEEMDPRTPLPKEDLAKLVIE